MTVTQLDGKKVLEPENLENRDKVLVLSKNINGAYAVKVMSTLTVKAMVEAISDPNTAFMLVEMKEPAAQVEPEPTTPEEPPEPETGNGEGPGDSGEGEKDGTEEPSGGEDGTE